MIFVIDVGNTNIVMGLFVDDELKYKWRMSTKEDRASDEYGMFINGIFANDNIDKNQITGVIISSVVPQIMYSLRHGIKKYIYKDPLIVGPGIRTGLNIRTDNPKEVGADRIINAVAAHVLYKGPLIIVDFGTATTYCAVSSKGDYIGGIISPGIKISAEALFEKTAKLPMVQLEMPEKAIGTNTIAGMQSGILLGHVGQMDYLVDKMKKEMCEKENIKETEIKVIGTGGLSSMISGKSSTINIINRNLTLEGLKIIYDRNL